MTVKETNIFDFLYDKLYFDINKPIRLFEAFSGIGTQAMALKRLGYQVNHVGISEIDNHALKSYFAIHGEVKNYGGIGSFERMPKDIDICSWSFPCQDISIAGKQRGMVDGSRSNYGYVFLDTIENTPYEERPKVLLMENVKALLSQTFSEDWKEINLRLERLGYKNYAESLIATDFGVPQTRDRVFIVSIKGEYSYTFPKPFKLNKKLKDYLEDEVDEKYYLSDKQIEQITSWNAQQKPLENAKSIDDDAIQTITAKSNTDIGVVVEDKRNLKEKLADELLENKVVKDGDVINHSYTNSSKNKNSRLKLEDYIESDNGITPTLTTKSDNQKVLLKDKREVIGTYQYSKSDSFMKNKSRFNEGKDISDTIQTSQKEGVVYNNLRIRKLTPLEAWRLMGIDDEDFYKAKATGMSDSQLYKQAGNAIVVDVLYYIFKQFIKGERK